MQTTKLRAIFFLLLRGKAPCDGDLADRKGIYVFLPWPAAVQTVRGIESGQKPPRELWVCPASLLMHPWRMHILHSDDRQEMDRLVWALPGTQVL